jgi:hypothetical protein
MNKTHRKQLTEPIFPHKKQLVFHSIGPIGPGVRTQTGCSFPSAQVVLHMSRAVSLYPSYSGRTDIDSPAHASGRSENILMFESQVQGSMSTHAQTCYSTSCAVFNGFIFCINCSYQLVRYKGFV